MHIQSLSRPIVLVEDNASDIELMLRSLQRAGVDRTVLVARDGEEALSLLLPDHPQSVNPVLILLDLKLPRVSGHEVLRQLRDTEAGHRYPVVVLTTSEAPEDIIEAYEAGANSYIRKPIGANAFDEMTRQLAKYWMELNIVPSG